MRPDVQGNAGISIIFSMVCWLLVFWVASHIQTYVFESWQINLIWFGQAFDVKVPVSSVTVDRQFHLHSAHSLQAFLFLKVYSFYKTWVSMLPVKWLFSRSGICCVNSRRTWTTWPLRMGPIGCPEMLAANCQVVLCKIPEEQSPHLHWSGSLKSHILFLWYRQIYDLMIPCTCFPHLPS